MKVLQTILVNTLAFIFMMSMLALVGLAFWKWPAFCTGVVTGGFLFNLIRSLTVNINLDNVADDEDEFDDDEFLGEGPAQAQSQEQQAEQNKSTSEAL